MSMLWNFKLLMITFVCFTVRNRVIKISFYQCCHNRKWLEWIEVTSRSYLLRILTTGCPVTGPTVRAQRTGTKVPITVVGRLLQINEFGNFRLFHHRRSGQPEFQPQPPGRPLARCPLVATPCSSSNSSSHTARLPVLPHQRLANLPEVRQTVPTSFHCTTPGYSVTLTVGIQQHLDDL